MKSPTPPSDPARKPAKSTHAGFPRRISSCLIALSLLLFGCLPSLAVKTSDADYEQRERRSAEDKAAKVQESMKRSDVPIRFFGVVFDQDDNPIAEAEVALHILRFSPIIATLFGDRKEIRVKTDARGAFSVGHEKGRSLWVATIQKEGYAFLTDSSNVRDFRYSGEMKPFIPEQSSPVVLHMRKIGEVAFLIENRTVSISFSPAESGQTKGYDFARQMAIRNLAKLTYDGSPLTCDLLVTATLNNGDGSWRVVLAPGMKGGGILLSTQLLYEAPEAGYVSEYAFTPEDMTPVTLRYVYLRTRDPAIFTRLELDVFQADGQFLRLNGKAAVTNPYGDRNLELVPDLPSVVRIRLLKEAEAAFRQNKRPVKPDLPQLISEAKEKAAQDKAKP